ncbi:MAG: hypothetical protein DHS20C21_22100 [Gemmatimonadota bacterium]|nr:MAG: hypothetical protein DHS20C21_22100 [Gemmatimonadota bacterium]
MARVVPSTLMRKLSELDSSSGWVWIYELTVSGGAQVIRVANNEEPVVWGEQTYDPFPVQFDQIEETNRGDLSRIRLTVSNVLREVESQIERHGGFEGDMVHIRLVNEGHLVSGLESIDFGEHEIESVETNAISAVFNLQPPVAIDENQQRRYSPRCTATYLDPKSCRHPRPEDLPEGVVISSTCDYTRDGPNGCRAHGEALAAQGEAVWASLFPTVFGGFKIPKSA